MNEFNIFAVVTAVSVSCLLRDLLLLPSCIWLCSKLLSWSLARVSSMINRFSSLHIYMHVCDSDVRQERCLFG